MLVNKTFVWLKSSVNAQTERSILRNKELICLAILFADPSSWYVQLVCLVVPSCWFFYVVLPSAVLMQSAYISIPKNTHLNCKVYALLVEGKCTSFSVNCFLVQSVLLVWGAILLQSAKCSFSAMCSFCSNWFFGEKCPFCASGLFVESALSMQNALFVQSSLLVQSALFV